jgi:hypothetical protein
MLRREALIRTGISEVRIAYIIRVERTSELDTTNYWYILKGSDDGV